jgi:single-stranded DNA-binding protein
MMMTPFCENPMLGTVIEEPNYQVMPDGRRVACFKLMVDYLIDFVEGSDVNIVVCNADDKVADFVHRYCPKGQEMLVQGKTELNTHGNDDKGAHTRLRVSCIVKRIWVVGFRDGVDGAYGLRRRCPFLRMVGALRHPVSTVYWFLRPFKRGRTPEARDEIPF